MNVRTVANRLATVIADVETAYKVLDIEDEIENDEISSTKDQEYTEVFENTEDRKFIKSILDLCKA